MGQSCIQLAATDTSIYMYLIQQLLASNRFVATTDAARLYENQ